jgi:membrane protein CcdC involved in cytochrome C biogenesis
LLSLNQAQQSQIAADSLFNNRSRSTRCPKDPMHPLNITPTDYAVASLFGAIVIILWRIREGRSPVTLKKILIPPAGMATGFSMFFVPICRVPWLWGISAFLLGATLLAWPLNATTKLYRDGSTVMMKRSSAFLMVVVVLAAIRFFARGYFDQYVSVEQTGAVFYLLAFGMILCWRLTMFFNYRKLVAKPIPSQATLVEDPDPAA